MSKGMPSTMALLGLLAVAGYQNRKKLAEMIRDASQNRPEEPNRGTKATGTSQMSEVLGEIGSLFGGASAGGALSDGLDGLIERFRSAGQSDAADSWVSTGKNQDLQPDQLASALGDDTVAELARKTGLSRSEVLMRLSRAVPEAVNRFTPDGRLPSASEAQNYI